MHLSFSILVLLAFQNYCVAAQEIADITQVPAYSALASCPARIVSEVIDDSTSPICPAGSPPRCFCENEPNSKEWSDQISTNVLNNCIPLTSARIGATQAAAVFAAFCSLALETASASASVAQTTTTVAQSTPMVTVTSLEPTTSAITLSSSFSSSAPIVSLSSASSSAEPPTTTAGPSDSATSRAGSAISSTSTQSVTPCSDAQWNPNPENWYDADVDQELASWWANTTEQRNSTTFVDWLAQSFGDMSRDQKCGIGDSDTCSVPDCSAFQSAGGPRWVYFVRIAVVNMNTLFDHLKSGMSDAESGLSLVITDMAQNFFPYKDPRTNLEKALPWIQAIVSSVLGFVPGIGTSFEAGANFEKWSSGIVNAAQAFTAGGFQVVEQNLQSAGDPVAHELGTIQELGVLIKNEMTSMQDGLGLWSTTLFNGQQDASGKTIIDYLAYGRFTLPDDVSEPFLDDAYLQVQVSKLVDEQWQSKNVTQSRTFVMCTNATDTCSDISRYTEGDRTCCLYSMNQDATYTQPSKLDTLGNATYNITPADITASALHTYIIGGLNYNDTDINDIIEQTISLETNQTFLAQGVRFQGVWTLPVCDVGQNGMWVADPADGMMPCCCGSNCIETETFWMGVGISSFGKARNKCKSQCPSCPAISIASRNWAVFGFGAGERTVLLLLVFGVTLFLL